MCPVLSLVTAQTADSGWLSHLIRKQCGEKERGRQSSGEGAKEREREQGMRESHRKGDGEGWHREIYPGDSPMSLSLQTCSLEPGSQLDSGPAGAGDTGPSSDRDAGRAQGVRTLPGGFLA